VKEGEKGTIFVFGSNLAGRHGAGSALHARMYKGAEYGRGSGRQGNSYAIPTKDYDVETKLPLERIKLYVQDFIEYAKAHPGLTFQVVRVGCGNAGYKDDQMAPLFAGCPSNVRLQASWKRILSAGQDLSSSSVVKQA
jgi:hypothetical protein